MRCCDWDGKTGAVIPRRPGVKSFQGFVTVGDQFAMTTAGIVAPRPRGTRCSISWAREVFRDYLSSVEIMNPYPPPVFYSAMYSTIDILVSCPILLGSFAQWLFPSILYRKCLEHGSLDEIIAKTTLSVQAQGSFRHERGQRTPSQMIDCIFTQSQGPLDRMDDGFTWFARARGCSYGCALAADLPRYRILHDVQRTLRYALAGQSVTPITDLCLGMATRRKNLTDIL